MQAHLEDHLRTWGSSPGILQVRSSAHTPDVVEYLAAAAYASDAVEWENACWFVP